MESHLHKSSSSSFNLQQNNNSAISKGFGSKIIGNNNNNNISQQQSSNDLFSTKNSLKSTSSFFHNNDTANDSGNSFVNIKSTGSNLPGHHGLSHRRLRSLSWSLRKQQQEECRSLNNNDNPNDDNENEKVRIGSITAGGKDGLPSGNSFNFNIDARKRPTTIYSSLTSKKKFPNSNTKYNNQNQNHQFYRRDGNDYMEDFEQQQFSDENHFEQKMAPNNNYDNNFVNNKNFFKNIDDEDSYRRNQFRALKNSSSNNNINLVDWLETELDQRGIDSVVYGRHLLSLLQQYSNEQANNFTDSAADLDPIDGSSSSSNSSSNNNNNFRKYNFGFSSKSSDGGGSGTGSTYNRYQQYERDPMKEYGGGKKSPGRYCEQHQRLYRKINGGGGPKENTQKPPSTTKWMHKRYLQGKNSNGDERNSIDDDDYFLSGYDHDCPDCQQRIPKDSLRDIRKLSLLNCLRSAIDKDSASYENLEIFIEELCIKYDQQQLNEKRSSSDDYGRRFRYYKTKSRTNYSSNFFNNFQQQQNRDVQHEDCFNNNSHNVKEEKLERNENSAGIKNQALKYYDAFPALCATESINERKNLLTAKDSNSNNSSRSSMSSNNSSGGTGHKNSNLIKLSSFQSSMEDSVFTPETTPSTPTKTNDKGSLAPDGLQTISNQSSGDNSASWNGQKIIKKILVSKDRIQSQSISVGCGNTESSSSSSSPSFKSSAVTHDSAKPLLKKKTPIANSILGVVGSRANRTRTGMIVAPTSLAGPLSIHGDDGLHNLTTLKKIGPSTSTGSSTANDGDNSRKDDNGNGENNDGKGGKKGEITKRSNSMENQSESSNENTSSKFDREMEKILNLMPSFFCPTSKNTNNNDSSGKSSSSSNAKIVPTPSSSSEPLKNEPKLEQPSPPPPAQKPISIFELKNQNLQKLSNGNSQKGTQQHQSINSTGGSPLKIQPCQKNILPEAGCRENTTETLGGGVMDLLPDFLKSRIPNSNLSTAEKPKESILQNTVGGQPRDNDDQKNEISDQPTVQEKETNHDEQESKPEIPKNDGHDHQDMVKVENSIESWLPGLSSTNNDHLLTGAGSYFDDLPNQPKGEHESSLCESIEEWLNDQNSESNNTTENWKAMDQSFLDDPLPASHEDDDDMPINRKRIEYLLNIWNQNSCLGYMEAQSKKIAQASDQGTDFKNLESELLSIVDFHRMLQISDDFMNDSNTDSFFEISENNMLLTPSVSSLNGVTSSILSDLFRSTETDLKLNEPLMKFDDKNDDQDFPQIYLDSPKQNPPTIGSFLTSLITDEQNSPTISSQNETDGQPTTTASMPYSKRYKLKSKSNKTTDDGQQSSLNETNGHIVTAKHDDLLAICRKHFQGAPKVQDGDSVQWRFYQGEGEPYDENFHYYNQEDEENLTNLEAYGNDLYNYDGYLLNIPSNEMEMNFDGDFLSRTLNVTKSTVPPSSSTNFYDALDIKFKLENRLVPDDDSNKPVLKPCAFFLENSCARVDCKYSHDLSSIPCRYYNEGACFKGEFCPFLHDKQRSDQILNSESSSTDGGGSSSIRQLDPNAKSFQFRIESDSDFPSLFENELQSLTQQPPKNRVDFYFKNDSEAGIGNNFDQITARERSPKGGSSMMKMQQILNNSVASGSQFNSISPNFARLFNEKQRKQYGMSNDGNGAEEWPSLSCGGGSQQDFPALQAKPETATASTSNKNAKFSNTFSNFREKIVKPNQKDNHNRNQGPPAKTDINTENSDSNSGKLSGPFASLKALLNAS